MKLLQQSVLTGLFIAVGVASAQPATSGSAPAVPQIVDLRDVSPEAAAWRDYWGDRYTAAKAKWDGSPNAGRPFPAFALSHTFRDARIVVSMLIDMYDCEQAQDGRHGTLTQKCPMRVFWGGPNEGGTTKTFESVCTLDVPPIKRGEGPQADANHTQISLDGRTVRIRVIEFGRVRPDCEASYTPNHPRSRP
jgi:hypothetical protein